MSPRDIQTTKAQRRMREFEVLSREIEKLAAEVVDAAFRVHKTLGPGLLESVYEVSLAYELRKRGLKLETQVELPVV
jgi:hypothetical protein